MKKFFQILIQHDNRILRDHRVYGVRILPGVTFVDLLYRLIENQFDKHDIALSNILFHKPLSTDGLIDRLLKIEVDCYSETVWNVLISSQQKKEGVTLDIPPEEHMTCSIFLSPIHSKAIPIEPKAFIAAAKHVWEMEDIYGLARSSEITHLDFMKTLGKVYQNDDAELMVLNLSDSAERLRSTFKAAPPFLDGATFAGQSFALNNKNENVPYIPFSIKNLVVYNQFPKEIYVYSKNISKSESIKPDIVKTDIVIYDAHGKVIAEFQELAAKRIRNRDLIDRLVTTVPKPSETIRVDFVQNTEERIRQFLKQSIGMILGKRAEDIKIDIGFYDLGLDSTQLLGLTKLLEKHCGHEFYPTLLFEYQTINEIAAYLMQKDAAVFSSTTIHPKINESKDARNRPQRNIEDEIAIIGLAGQYPEAKNIREFWPIIREAKNCIREIPENHWDVKEFYKRETVFNVSTPHTASQWGGFVPDADKFDPLFFEISPKEAAGLDPQLRLMLQTAWEVLEDAGYTRESLKMKQVGVYVGVMNDDYTWVAAEHLANTGHYVSTGSYAHELSNRISYHLNFHGPSLTVETACSSSFTAIHLARQAILNGECDCALAGGVNLNFHRSKYFMLSQLGIMSPDGKERTFDENANGYVPGEGVGLVMLKRYTDALKDGDHIYGVIKGSTINHSGQGPGKYVPNFNALAAACLGAIQQAKISPVDIDYIETHGTGTKLGDPIEIQALSKAFEGNALTKSCALGSKSTIGHLESASGICSLTKVLLAIKHNEIPSCGNFENSNPGLRLDLTPFYIPKEVTKWVKPVGQRVVGIHSFGVGGSNGFMVVQGVSRVQSDFQMTPALIPLSARTKEQLKIYASNLLRFLREEGNRIILEDFAYTLQVGREAMEDRLGLLANSTDDLIEKLTKYLANEPSIEAFYTGHNKEVNETLDHAVDTWIKHKKYETLLKFWTKGLNIDWNKLYSQSKPKRISLPTYPFANKRYWIEEKLIQGEENQPKQLQHSFRVTLTGEEAFVRDHIIKGKKILPGVAHLEIAREAIKQAFGDQRILLQNIVWTRPIIIENDPVTVHIDFLRTKNGNITFKMFTKDRDSNNVFHSQGLFSTEKNKESIPEIDIDNLKSSYKELTPDKYSRAFDQMAMKYGPIVNQGVEKIYVGMDGSVLTQLILPPSVLENQADLYPMKIDVRLVVSLTSSLLVSSVMAQGNEAFSDKPVLPFVLSSLEIFSPCSLSVWAVIKSSPEQISDSVQKLDIVLYDDVGKTCAVMKGVSLRVLELPTLNIGIGTLMLSTAWQRKPIEESTSVNKELQVHVIRFDEGKSASFEDNALELFDNVRAVIQSKPKNEHLVQVLIKDFLEFGLSGFLKTAHLENPKIYGQIILIENSPKSIEAVLKENQKSLEDKEIWYDGGLRKVKEVEELPESMSKALPPYKENGVYLITGGAGGLGLIFAKDIVANANSTTVILIGRSELSSSKEKELKEIQVLAASTQSTVQYHQLAITDKEATQTFIKTAQTEHGSLNGIIHAAGIIKDNFILKKSREDFKSVLYPKVQGTLNLDEATKEINLDFFVLFSSLAGVMGNLGQADYATGNAFMDAFAEHRNKLVSSKKRKGLTLSINWPLWKEGGMSVDESSEKMMETRMGLFPMKTVSGLQGFAKGLSSQKGQVILVEGFLNQIRQWLFPHTIAKTALSSSFNSFNETIEEMLKNEISKVLKIDKEDLDLDTQFSKYGFDSITLTDFANNLNQKYDLELAPTIFFEYPSLKSFTSYLCQNLETQLAPHFVEIIERPASKKSQIEQHTFINEKAQNAPEAIAIVGMSGQFPMAHDIDALWNNLVVGKDCISEIPKSRWDWQALWGDPTREDNRTNIKWSGFIEDTEHFDPLFFGISPREALLMDPQQRLLMQYVWLAMEDAGYSAKSLSGTNTGMFVGTTSMGYNMLIERAQIPIEGYTTTGVFPSIGPNRMSYFLNLHGPSEPIETSCSSSLVAIHRAVVNIQNGSCDQAFVGGVNTISNPDGHISFNKAGMLSEDGRCKTFSKNANGYVRSEGVGILFLKKLKDAEADGDHIYGIIRGSAENHGGRANSLTAPNPKAQAEVIKAAYRKAKIDPRTINYIEAHGTGTPLGDPVEINGLKAAFKELYTETEKNNNEKINLHCGLGSIKTNIGHLELAAGVAGVIKVLLQLQHKKLVKSLHGEEQNPYIDLKDSPFYFVKGNQEWSAPNAALPRRAGISSFGFGGSNAHIIIEEYIPKNARRHTLQINEVNPALFVLSAKTSERLKVYAHKLLEFLRDHKNSLDLEEIAYTLQIGRDAMEERLGIVASSIEDLIKKLQKYIDNEKSIVDLYAGHVNKKNESLFASAEEIGKSSRLLELWVKGTNIDWNTLYGRHTPRRIRLPTYPFVKERYWISGTEIALLNNKARQSFLHPLVQKNTSMLSEQKYSSTFTGKDFFLCDHIVKGHKILPGVVYLEMAREAVKLALGHLETNIQLHNIVWIKPFVVEIGPKEINIRLFPEQNGDVAFEIYSQNGESETVIHCQGKAIVENAKSQIPHLEIEGLKSTCNQQKLSSTECYETFSLLGIHYGPAHKGIENIYIGKDSVLAKIILPSSMLATQSEFELHPSIMDSALQSSIGMLLHSDLKNPLLPFALDTLEVFSPLTSSMWAIIRHSKEQVSDLIQKLDVAISDENGRICLAMNGLSLRLLEGDQHGKNDNVDQKMKRPIEPIPQNSLIEKVADYLKRQLSTVLKLPIDKIESTEPLEKYGIDSFMVIQLTNELEKTFGSLSKTLFFEYQNIHELSQYFIESHSSKLMDLLRLEDTGNIENQPSQNSVQNRFLPTMQQPLQKKDEIAIVGISGRYPESWDLSAYWANLRDGKDCIIEIPSSRWDWKKYFDQQGIKQGTHYSKWGGFIEGVDEFDPLFFNISPKEAIYLDPQERLFLEHTWMALEDAGLNREHLQKPCLNDLPGQVGVYVGVMWNEYQLFGAEASWQGTPVSLGSSFASIANRVSYVLNLHGPSMTVDTMCSSSLTSIHLACEDLKSGRTDIGIAGGVNVTIHPNKYLALSNGQFISKDGHCQSFGEGGDGYIPGEGVGVVILKRLSNAIADGDHIYGVIKGTAINHGGKTNGYSVPNPNAQQMVITRALKESKINPRTISYIEAHGTGTKLGDPIEITGLTKAFASDTTDTGYCALGSAKSNIGHCESAAGIAGLTKVLLQMQHRQIVPSLHSQTLNPNINFEKSPFVVNQELKEWKRPIINGKEYPRIAGISSFGAGGSNAHVIIQEYILKDDVTKKSVVNSPSIIVLSAKNSERLKEYAQKLLDFIQQKEDDSLNLEAVAYTLQMGREAMEERLGIMASSLKELQEKLQKYIRNEESAEGLYVGQVSKHKETLSLLTSDEDLKTTILIWIEKRKYSKILELWVKGLNIDWSKLYGERKISKISLPTYPFAREKYWIEPKETVSQPQNFLHPLVQENTSTLFSEQRFSSVFTQEDCFLKDHIVNGQKLLPGVAYLEMAREAVKLSLGDLKANIQLKNIVWIQPLTVEDEPKTVHIGLFPEENGNISFEIYTNNGETEVIIHCQGFALILVQENVESIPDLDIEALKSTHNHKTLTSFECYHTFDRLGIKYGPTHRGIEKIYIGENSVLAKLNIPSISQGEFELHPSIMDSALQASLGMFQGDELQLMLPFSLSSLELMSPCTTSMWVAIRRSPEQVNKLDYCLCDESGKVCVVMHGLSSKLLSTGSNNTIMLSPVWKEKKAENLITADVHTLVLRFDKQVSTFEEKALELFKQVQNVIQTKRKNECLFQVVINDPIDFGLSGILKTAHLENSKIYGQIILITDIDNLPGPIEKLLKENQYCLQDTEIWYEGNRRQIKELEEVRSVPKETHLYKEEGVYLITGGTGGLGLIFAKNILENIQSSTVILTGRSKLGSTIKDKLRPLQVFAEGTQSEVAYIQADITNKEDVQTLIETIHKEYGSLNGIIHAAGIVKDNFILKKTQKEFLSVLMPKVRGTIYLDDVTKNIPLDFFILFSSLAGASGNIGQADYATGNAFMDAFAKQRNTQVAAQKRHGRTLSINWPLWKEGGMYVDNATEQMIEAKMGMIPMKTSTGLKGITQSFASGKDQMLIVEGSVRQIKSYLYRTWVDYSNEREMDIPILDKNFLHEKLSKYLKQQLSTALKLPMQKIDSKEPLETYGIDSVMITQLTNELEKAFGTLSKTLFFEYQTIDGLSQYFMMSHLSKVTELLQLEKAQTKKSSENQVASKITVPNLRPRSRFTPQLKDSREQEIAIVGISGRYPQSEDLKAYWENLRDGKDCITEIPINRWDWRKYYDRDKETGIHSSMWGGFIEGVDQFDPLFFNISPREAALLDPQERLFLEHTWMALEDAALIRENLQKPTLNDLPGQVGVYAGVMWNEYQLFGAEATLQGTPVVLGSSFASIANRVSYVLNIHGPSMTVDTMCSSSLTSIHLACEDLKSGRTNVGIAGGVNVSIHPNKYLALTKGQFISKDGNCQSFGEGGDGYIPGEGVGVVILKRLSNAISDGDHIYGIIKGTAINHGGKTNGYSVPNPNAQQMVITQVLKESKIDPRTISYIEAHGTGTKLGDPIEITGLTKAFASGTIEKGYCALGSAKSNIGHCESAAGIAGVTKVLLQMKHKKIVPSLHSKTLNPNIDFDQTPFVVNQELKEWKRPVINGKEYPRIAGVSSFGAGGSNAHIIIEEYIPKNEVINTTNINSADPALIILSAKNSERLKEYAQKLLDFIQQKDDVSLNLEAIAYTLQVGREPMEERLGIIVSSLEELQEKLSKYLAVEEYIDDLYRGQLITNKDGVGALNTDPEFFETIEKWIMNKKFSKILEFWTKGLNIDWTKLYQEQKPKKITLPTYPFAKERYWLGTEISLFNKSVPTAQRPLHPFVHFNTSPTIKL